MFGAPQLSRAADKNKYWRDPAKLTALGWEPPRILARRTYLNATKFMTFLASLYRMVRTTASALICGRNYRFVDTTIVRENIKFYNVRQGAFHFPKAQNPEAQNQVEKIRTTQNPNGTKSGRHLIRTALNQAEFSYINPESGKNQVEIRNRDKKIVTLRRIIRSKFI